MWIKHSWDNTARLNVQYHVHTFICIHVSVIHTGGISLPKLKFPPHPSSFADFCHRFPTPRASCPLHCHLKNHDSVWNTTYTCTGIMYRDVLHCCETTNTHRMATTKHNQICTVTPFRQNTYYLYLYLLTDKTSKWCPNGVHTYL